MKNRILFSEKNKKKKKKHINLSSAELTQGAVQVNN